MGEWVGEWVGVLILCMYNTLAGCVSLTTKGSGGTAHTCNGRHS